jgi:threonine dehydrogenase-like Zn-dependent dehydrogenase
VKALVYLGPRRMELQDLQEPEPGPGEARVRVAAAAICGSDLHGFREASPRRVPPLVMGHEAVGVVDAAGGDVAPGLVGARVAAMPLVACGSCDRCTEGRPNLCPDRRLMGMHFPGAFAEAFTIEAGQLLPVPGSLSDGVAALAEPYANAIHAVDRSVQPQDRVLVIGAGPIGLFAVRAAVEAGAARTFVVDRVRDRLALAERQGAEPVEAEGAAGTIERMTGGAGVDVVVDAAGFPQTWALAVDAVRPGGRIEAIGLGAAEGPLSYQQVVAKGVTIAGSYACVQKDFERAFAGLVAGHGEIAEWVAAMPLARGQAAFEELADEGLHTKVVLVP